MNVIYWAMYFIHNYKIKSFLGFLGNINNDKSIVCPVVEIQPVFNFIEIHTSLSAFDKKNKNLKTILKDPMYFFLFK